VERDRQRAMALLEAPAHSGDVRSQVALGRIFADDSEGTADLVTARTWFERAAEAGDPDAQAWMGDCCRHGLTEEANPETAESWYRRAATGGHVGALIVLATALASLQGRTAEQECELFGLWLAAAASGHPRGQREAGRCYLEGKGCAQDATAAARWFQSAVDQGDAEAEYQLGNCYLKGRGVKKDLAAARLLLERAARRGHEAASNTLSTGFTRRKASRHS